MEAVQGLKTALVKEFGGEINSFFLEDYKAADFNLLRKQLSTENYNFAISVGPEATSFLWSDKNDLDLSRFYTMVLSPEKLIESQEKACGISLSIPISTQLRTIKQQLSSVKRLGLLFNPEYNSDFYKSASRQAHLYEMEIVPLKISSQKDIPEVLRQKWDEIDGLWLIPDRTVISKSVVEYIIKEALYQKKPVIGYNRFFYESGAALAFILDYSNIGKQTAEFVLDKLDSGYCSEKTPAFEAKLNLEVLKKIGYIGP